MRLADLTVRDLRFAFLGLFLGPVLLAVLLAIWDEWLRPAPAAPQG
jgi:predicted PurR-regulated permease PerM